jgi:photosystem II stability/assembly factor-like uncharacterized protein
MRELMTAAVAGFVFAAAAFALPADLVVVSDREVRPDEAGGLYYLGQTGGGYLYNGLSAAVGRVAPYSVLDRDAQTKDYYIVRAPAWVGVTPEAFAHLGAAVRLSDMEILVGLERGFGPGELRAVEHRIELRKLEPVTPVDWKADAEPPPTKKDPRIEGAINSITAAEYAGYIKELQDFKTRCTDTTGNDGARDYIRDFFSAQGLTASWFEFEHMGFMEAYYADAAGRVYVRTNYSTIKRSKNNGETWDTIWPEGTNCTPSVFWYDRDTGFVGGYNNRIAKTTDGGDTWETTEFAPGYPEYIYRPFAAYFVSPEIGWLGGACFRGSEPPKGFVVRTTDGGRNWVPQSVPEGLTLQAMGFFSAAYGWAGGHSTTSGGLLYTANGGESWQECSVPVGFRLVEDIAAVGPKEAWAVVDSNRLLHTTDGLTWSWVNTSATRQLYRVEFPDRQCGYAAGYELIATDDGGATWRTVPGLPTGVCYALSFADRNRGVLGERYGGYLYRTDDGGASFVNIKDNMDVTAENVIGERRGDTKPEEIIITGGHFDSTSDMVPSVAPGAEDNASGAACAMAAARAFRGLPFNRTVRYVAFGAEEHGLVGSYAYANYCAQKGEKIVAVLNADMVCYDEDGGARDDFVAGGGDNGAWMYDYLAAVGALYGQKIIYDRGENVSDDLSFERVGYAAMGVIEGEKGSGGFLEYPYYHTTEDTLDKLHPDLGVRFVRDYAAMFAHLAGVSDVGVNEPRPGGASVPFVRPFAVYPNPYCYATGAGGVNFIGLKAPARVEIYDLAGRRVAREEVAAGRDACVWGPAGIGGEALSPGVYLYRVEGQGQEEAGKLVIAR